MRDEVGKWTEVVPATQEDIDYVEANFREGDRAEHEAFGGRRTLLSDFESCWTVRHRGETIGYCGVAVPYGASVFAPGRWLCYMSCENANRYRFAYVRDSREVMRRIVAETPAYVTVFRSMPAERYAASVKWHARVLRMRRIATGEVNGERVAVFETTREEVMS